MGTRYARRGSDADLRGHVRRAQRVLDDALSALDRSVEPIVIHGVRIAARRLRILLHAFKKEFSAPTASAYREALSGLTHDLERAREAQVAFQALVALASAQRGGLRKQSAPLIGRALEEQERAVEELRAKLRTQAWQTRRADLRRGARDPQLLIVGAPQGPLIESVLRRQRRRLRRGLSRTGSAARELHKLRFEVKALRYLTEELAPNGADFTHDELDHLRGLQDCLGAIHDAWCLKRTLKRQDRYRRPARALRAQLDQRRDDLLREFRMRRKMLTRFWRCVARGVIAA